MGRAKFMNELRYSSNFFDSIETSLYNSKLTKPTQAAVVVTMAGMIFPAISLVLRRFTIGIP